MVPENFYPASRPPLPAVVSELRPAEAKSHFAFTVFKWYPLILAFGAVLMVAATVAMLLKPVLPSATARILIKTGPDTLPITGLPVSAGRASPEYLQTEAELLTSRIVLLPVARALRQEQSQTVTDDAIDGDVSALRAGLVVTVVANTTMLEVRKSAPTEAEAARLLRMIIDSYVDQHASAYSGSTRFETFFEREAGTAAASLKEAEDRLQRWRETNKVVAAEEQLLAQLAAVVEFEGSLKRTETDIEGTRAQMAALARDIAALPRESVTSRENMANPLIARLKADIATEEAALRDLNRSPVTERLRIDIAGAELATRDASASPLVGKLKGDLVTAELALNDLRQRYTDEDRRVQEKLEQIERLQQSIVVAEREAVTAAEERTHSLRRELAAAQGDVEHASRARIAGLRAQLIAAERDRDVFGRETVAPNPLREILNRDLVSARARLTALGSQRDGLRDQLNEARTTLAHLRDKRVEAERMGREVELAKAVYLQNTKRLDDARLMIGLRRHQLTNIAVTEPPRATAGSHSPKQVALVALLGAVLGLALGVATALVLDFFNWSLRTRDDVEFYLGVPALAAVPAIAGPSRPPRSLPTLEDRDMSTHARHERGRD
jgi:uncharacterized protein involved in exopolysaccharide biosynthesis